MDTAVVEGSSWAADILRPFVGYMDSCLACNKAFVGYTDLENDVEVAM
jgi:hypothetical protein